MKNFIFLVLFLLFPTCAVFSQTGKNAQTLVKENGIRKVSYNGQTFDIDTTTIGHTNGTSNNYILNVNSNSTNIDVSNYPTGIYTVALIVNGQIADAKNLIKQ
jgi:hypothetical protein